MGSNETKKGWEQGLTEFGAHLDQKAFHDQIIDGDEALTDEEKRKARKFTKSIESGELTEPKQTK